MSKKTNSRFNCLKPDSEMDTQDNKFKSTEKRQNRFQKSTKISSRWESEEQAHPKINDRWKREEQESPRANNRWKSEDKTRSNEPLKVNSRWNFEASSPKKYNTFKGGDRSGFRGNRYRNSKYSNNRRRGSTGIIGKKMGQFNIGEALVKKPIKNKKTPKKKVEKQVQKNQTNHFPHLVPLKKKDEEFLKPEVDEAWRKSILAQYEYYSESEEEENEEDKNEY